MMFSKRAPLAARAAATGLLTAGILVTPPAASGQSADTLVADADTFALPGVVVTATRVPLDRKALPTPVSVITASELRTSGVRTLADALRSVPGATVVRSGPTGAQTSLFMRGGESDYVQVLVDGVSVNDPGGSFDFASLSVDRIERIEVVRGPVSVLYGSDAVAGVIQVFTRRGAGAPTVTAEVTGGQGERRHADASYGTYDAEVGVQGGAGSLSYAVGGGTSHDGGLYPFNNQHTRNSGSLRVGWTARAGTELAVTSRLTDSRSHFPTDGGGALVDENAYLDRRLWTTALEGGWQIGERVDARVQLGLVTRDQASVDRPDGPDDTTGIYASLLEFHGVRQLADARVNVRLPRTVVTAGVALENASASTSYASESAFGPFEASAEYDRATAGYYAQSVVNPFDRLYITAGGRRDDSDTYGTFDTYRFGAALELMEGTRVRGALGRAFREPTFAEAFGSGFGDAGNPALEPEHSRSWEVGMEHDLGPATFAATWFDQSFESLIQYTFTPPAAGEPNYFNVGAASANGLELEARTGAGRWSGSASYAYLETRVLDPGLATDASFAQGEPLLRRPTHAGSLAFRYTLDGAAAAMNLDVVGEREDMDFGAGWPAPRVILPAYATVDLAGEYTVRVTRAPVTLLARVENLLDADYTAVAGFPGTGRLVRLGARLSLQR